MPTDDAKTKNKSAKQAPNSQSVGHSVSTSFGISVSVAPATSTCRGFNSNECGQTDRGTASKEDTVRRQLLFKNSKLCLVQSSLN